MAIWKESTPSRPVATPATATGTSARYDATSGLEIAPSVTAVPTPRVDSDPSRKESVIAADITIEGKIEGGGSVRIAGKFKGDVTVQGDLTIEVGAKLTGSVRADKVMIAGELEGNVVQASRVDLLKTAIVSGELKAGSLTVEAGARMRGQAEFGWDDDKGSKSPAATPTVTAWSAAQPREQSATGHSGRDPRVPPLPGNRARERRGVPRVPTLPALRHRRRRRSGSGEAAGEHAAAHRRQHPRILPTETRGNTR